MRFDSQSREARVLERIWVDLASGCWLWIGARNPSGYGHFKELQVTLLAHRVAYELFVGPIPEGLQIDHLCRVRHCVNPAHMDPVTQRENILRGESRSGKKARQTRCIRGHDLAGENLRTNARGHRRCRQCDALRAAERSEAEGP